MLLNYYLCPSELIISLQKLKKKMSINFITTNQEGSISISDGIPSESATGKENKEIELGRRGRKRQLSVSKLSFSYYQRLQTS
jgi:hypothetical protein